MAKVQGENRPEWKLGADKNEGPLRSSGAARLFEIRVKGHLDSQWSDWLEGLEVKLLDNGEMILCGPIVDQAALMGVLNKLARLNLGLISVKEINRKEGEK